MTITIQQIEQLKRALDQSKSKAMGFNAERASVINRGKELCTKFNVSKVEELETLASQYEAQVGLTMQSAQQYLEGLNAKFQNTENTLTN